MAHYYAYILQCNDGTFYVGHTNNLVKRLKQHNGLVSGGAKYTRSKRPVILRYSESCETRSLAMHREYILKTYSHKKKENLCR